MLSSIGMKQGCNLSPSLSNIYQNELHDLFISDCDPVELDGHRFNSLSWADDLVLISNSDVGLQKCLNNLRDYCQKWAISINPSKSSCMIMSKGKSKYCRKMKIDGHELQFTHNVTYLGIKISHNMSKKSMIEDRILKANRATYLLRQALSSQGNVNVNLAINLFD